MEFKTLQFLFAFCLLPFAFSVLAQQAPPPSTQPPASSIAAPAASPVLPLLQDLQQTANATSGDINRLRVDKWKADAATKQQAGEMAASVSRNLASALPDLIQASRAQPASMAGQFKLYHNLTALYETLASLAETTGAFGSRQEFEALSADLSRLDAERHALSDYLQNLALQQDAELSRWRTEAARAAAAAAAAPPRKIVVNDDAAPASPAPKKKPPARSKPSTPNPPQ